jgi:hypothetical protein
VTAGGWLTWVEGLRHPIRWLHETTGGVPLAALLVLFAINAVDELARVAIAVSGPTIADSFGVGVNGVAVPFVLAFAAALGLAVPIATFADRGNRVRPRSAASSSRFFSVFGNWPDRGAGHRMAGMQVGKAFIELSIRPAQRLLRGRAAASVFASTGAAMLGALVGAIAAGYVAGPWAGGSALRLRPAHAGPSGGGRLPRCAAASGAAAGRGRRRRWPGGAPPSLAEAWRMCWQLKPRAPHTAVPDPGADRLFALYGSLAY